MMTAPDSVKLTDLVGLRVLDGRGEFVHPEDDARVVVMRLDGALYAFMEDRDPSFVTSWTPDGASPAWLEATER